MRRFSTRLNDSEYIEYLEYLVEDLEQRLAKEEQKFDAYIAQQHKETMSAMGSILSAAIQTSNKT